MSVILPQHSSMKKIFILFSFASLVVITGCHSASAHAIFGRDTKVNNIIYFNPEIFPDVEEIKEPTYSSFFSAVSDRYGRFRNYKMLRVDANIPFDSANAELLKEFCENNNADLAVVPKVKFFKVGLGKYVFSNQVVVSLKVYDAQGNYITETNYDTYRKNARLLGSAENSIKIGADGAMRNMGKSLRKLHHEFEAPIEN